MLGGLLGFYLCLLFVGLMGLVWMRVYLYGNKKYEGRYLSMRPLLCSIWGFGVVLIYLRDGEMRGIYIYVGDNKLY